MNWDLPPLETLGVAALAYLLGSIPFGLVFGFLGGAGDIRRIGSGNIGATNVLRTGNKLLAAATLVCDAGKAAVAILIARATLGEAAAIVAGGAAFLGHLFPVWLRFKGGKGVATGAGAMLALYWPAGVIGALVWIATALVFRMSSLAALATAVAVPIVMFTARLPWHGALAVLMALSIFYTHRDNIRRILAGTESKIGDKKK